MAHSRPADTDDGTLPAGLRRFLKHRGYELAGLSLAGAALAIALSLASWSPDDPSLNHAVDADPRNWLGYPGAVIADEAVQLLGLAGIALISLIMAWAMRLIGHEGFERPAKMLLSGLASVLLAAGTLAFLPVPQSWALGSGLGGKAGDIIAGLIHTLLPGGPAGVVMSLAAALTLAVLSFSTFLTGSGISRLLVADLTGRLRASVVARAAGMAEAVEGSILAFKTRRDERRNAPAAGPGFVRRIATALSGNTSVPPDRNEPKLNRRAAPAEPRLKLPPAPDDAGALDLDAPVPADETAFDAPDEVPEDAPLPAAATTLVTRNKPEIKPGKQPKRGVAAQDFELPPLHLLAEPKKLPKGADVSDDMLEANARALEGVLADFGVKGQIINVRPGPVVTLYELEPAPGIKSSRVIGLADDIARSMSAVSARVAVVPGRNAIGIELPNLRRETVYFRELMGSEAFEKTTQNLAMALGKNIGGEPIFADLTRMPHLLIAGTTGSGKSVGINTMILSLLYRLPPDRCKLIMIDPKMLELSVYEGIPHLLAPVVTDPRKAVVALKWAVREMEDRYRKMSKINVRNIDGYNAKVKQAEAKGETLSRTVQTGFDAETGEPVFEREEMDGTALPYIVVIIDEMADLMMVAGKDIEGAVQRLAQMARAAGIHVIMATQRPSVDVITGTIKANFPTRISFQVTSKIDSRTILGEQGGEQLLGAGDMLYMAGGGRITRLHGPFVSDDEVEKIVKHLKSQGSPDYVEAVTEEDEDAEYGEPGASAGVDGESGGSGDDLYDQAVAVILRDKKVSTSYVQRRLQIGYNKAASLIERMEKEGVITGANAQGKREVLVPGDSARD